MARGRVTYTGVADVRAGCYECSGDGTRWWEKNAVAVAALHHDATGHRTWAEQSIIIQYGKRPEDDDG